MSELINARDSRATIRWKLLTGASALALTSYVSSATLAKAEDSHPVLWLELGGEFDSLTDPSQIWVPANLPPAIDHPVTGVLGQTPRIGYDIDGKITFQPDGSDWNFSAAIQYGKSKRGPRSAHDQTYQTYDNGNKYVPTTYAFTDLHSGRETKHIILDFTAGKDLGLGLLGGRGSSTLNFGVRVAQFRERASGQMTAQMSAPHKYHISYFYGTKRLNANMQAARSFSGVGPSLSWNGSVPIAGSMEEGLAIDWGANAALLFGRQTTKVRTHTEKLEVTGYTYNYQSGIFHKTLVSAVLTHSTVNSVRNKSVMVPNLGGLVGLSFRHGNAKISVGYRADFFFGAIDGGIDTRKEENRGFFGPFASVSVGIGD
jgi:hypothetical protein